MKRVFLILGALFALLSIAGAQVTNPSASPSDSLRLFVFGSSTPAGNGASDTAHSFVGLLTTYLSGLSQPWTLKNYAVAGTTSTQMLASVKSIALTQKPTAVLLMPSLGNESNISSAADTAVTTYKKNLQQAIQLCRAAGIFVFLGTSPPRTDITTVTATYGATTLQQLQQAIVADEESWAGAEVLVDATNVLGDGAGSYLAAYTSDNVHPNDTGHAAIYNSIPIGRFNNLSSWSWGAVKSISKNGTRVPTSAGNSDVPWKIVLDRATTGSFAVSMWIKRDTAAAVTAYAGFSSTQIARFFQLASGKIGVNGNVTADVVLDPIPAVFDDLSWHHYVISYRAQDTKVSMYRDGVLVSGPTADATFLSVALDQVWIGNRSSGTTPAKGCWFKDVAVYRRPLWAGDVARIFRGDVPWGGLETFLPLSTPQTIGCRTPNVAGTDSFAVAGLTMDTYAAPIVPGTNGIRRTAAIAESFPRLQIPAGDINPLSTGRMTLVPIVVTEPTTVTNIGFVSGATAAVTPANWWFALYDSQLVLIGQTADQTSTAWGANTEKVLALTSAKAIAPGLYYVAIMVKAGTVPTLRGVTGLDTTLGALVPVGSGISTTSLTTTAPSGGAAITVSGTLPYCYLG